MKNRTHFLFIYILLAFISIPVAITGFEHIIQNDLILWGSSSSGVDKVFTVDVGDGANNPKMTVSNTSKDYVFSKALKTLADSIGLGDGDTTGDICTTFDSGSGANNIKICVLDTSEDLQIFAENYVYGRGVSEDVVFTVDIGLGGANPLLKWNDTTGKWQFSNDGSLFQDIGSGGGGAGGVNLLINADFEADESDWTETGSAVLAHVTSGSNLLIGLGSITIDFSASGEFLRSTLVAVPNGLVNRSCSSKLLYLSDSLVLGDVTYTVVDDLSNVLVDPVDLPPTTNGTAVTISIGYPCPAAGRSIQIELESTADAELIALDQAFKGETVFQEISTTQVVVHAYSFAQTSCVWTGAGTPSTFADMGTDTDCFNVGDNAGTNIMHLAPGITLATGDTDLPEVIVENMPPGTYHIQATFFAGNAGQATEVYFTMSDESTSSQAINTTMGAVHSTHTAGHFENDMTMNLIRTYTSTSDHTFKIQCYRSAAGLCSISNDLGQRALEFKITRYPLSTQNYLPVDAAGFFIDVSIGGGNADLGFAAQINYIEITNGGLDMVLNSGSSAIPCSGTNPSTGLTCGAGLESLGVVFDAPFAGKFRVCGEFTHQTDIGLNANPAFQWIETPNNAQTNLQLGNSRVGNSSSTGASNGTARNAIHICGVFDFGSAGQKTIRLMYEQDVGASAVNFVLMDRNVALGQWDLHITVEALSKVIRGVTFPELVITKGANQLFNFVSVVIDGAQTCTVLREYGDWVENDSSGGLSLCEFDIKVGTFSAAPICTCTAVFDSGTGICEFITGFPTASRIEFTMRNQNGSPSDANDFHVLCHGPL